MSTTGHHQSFGGSQTHTSCCSEETPCWHRISYAAKALLTGKFDLDLSQIGATQRLRYEDFEPVFYHLFLLIDPTETKRKFRGLHPARNQEERTRFIDTAVRFINDKQLHTQRVASSQLRMFGGAPFRSLLTSLIKTASERELESLRGRVSIESQLEVDQCGDDLVVLVDSLAVVCSSGSATRSTLHELKEQLVEMKKDLANRSQLVQEKWSTLMHRTEGFHSSQSYSQDRVSALCQSQLSRLEAAYGETKQAMERIKSVKLPESNATAGLLSTKDNGQSTVKRLSQFIREAKGQFDPDKELLREACGANMHEKIRQQLAEYDSKTLKLIETWREDQEKADEMLLKNPEILEKYNQLQQSIPMIALKPIEVDANHDVPLPDRPSLSDIESILKEYPDPRYDDRQIIETSRSYFQ